MQHAYYILTTSLVQVTVTDHDAGRYRHGGGGRRGGVTHATLSLANKTPLACAVLLGYYNDMLLSPVCLTEMPITGEKLYVVYKAVADHLYSPPITSIDPTRESTGSEMVSREIDPVDPVLFTDLLTTDNFPQTEY